MGPGTYASLRLKLDAWSSAVHGWQRGQKCSSPTRRLPSRSWGSIRPRVCSWFRAPIRHECQTAQPNGRGVALVAQCRPPYNAKLKLVYIIKYLHLLTSSQWRSMQWNSPLVYNGMPQGTKNSSRSSIGNWVSCLNDWLLLANAINYSRLSQLIALRNLTNPTNTNIH